MIICVKHDLPYVLFFSKYQAKNHIAEHFDFIDIQIDRRRPRKSACNILANQVTNCYILDADSRNCLQLGHVNEFM